MNMHRQQDVQARRKQKKRPNGLLAAGLIIAALHAPTISFAEDARVQSNIQKPSAAVQEIRRMIFHPHAGALLFRNMEQLFPSEEVPASNGAPLRQGSILAENIEEALVETKSNGLLVLHKGKIVYERYLNGASANSRFTSFSMSKSITSILVGIAIEKGLIHDVNDRVDTYLAELKGTVYDGVTIRQMLMMRSGTSYVEGYDPKKKPDLMKLFEMAMVRNSIHFTDFSGLNLTRASEPGSTYNYSTMETGLLGLLVERASGQRLAKFTAENLWGPAGMTQSAFWLLDAEFPKGQALAGGGFNATLRDYAKIGQLMLDGGAANGNQILSSEWVAESTTPTGTEPIIEGRPRGYQYHWWTVLDSDAYQAIGIHGQFIMVDPATETVIVKASHWPKSWVPELDKKTTKMFNRILAEVAQP